MGLNAATVQFLCCAKSIGVDFAETLTIGRQRLLDDVSDYAAALSAIGRSEEDIADLRLERWGEPIFRLFGAHEVCSLDASDYEQATYICDLNQPCLLPLTQKFSVVFDGGTLEHVFNLPQALKNCMEMVRLGGHFLQMSPANNLMGHGFWQFSPEAIFRIFSKENGFSTRAVFLHEIIRGGAWYRVIDPTICRSRVELCNRRRTYICAIAQRVADKKIFGVWPQQSDYVERWQQPTGTSDRQPRAHSIRERIPRPIKKLVRTGIWEAQRIRAGMAHRLYGRKSRPFDLPYYHHISADDVVRGGVLRGRSG
jgi:hypothetical protein